MAGSSAVQVGSATFVHPATMIEIIDGIESYMRRSDIAAVEGLKII
jgi:dihydroorotate dehydrogenase (NAD+) catalytic subunit